MGQLIQYRCSCGYNKELTVGGGLLANRETTVRSVFSDAELVSFNKAKAAGTLTRFFMEHEPALCPTCQELVEMPVLHYWEGLRERIRRKPCPTCGGGLLPQKEESAECPKCGMKMDATQSGLWD